MTGKALWGPFVYVYPRKVYLQVDPLFVSRTGASIDILYARPIQGAPQLTDPGDRRIAKLSLHFEFRAELVQSLIHSSTLNPSFNVSQCTRQSNEA